MAKAIFPASLALLLAVSLSVAGLRVCPRCGYESPDGPTHCTHCQAPLPASARPKRPVQPQGSSNKAFPVEFHSVAEEVTLARKYFGEGNYELARLFAQNAVALDLLSDRSGRPEGSAVIADLLEQARKRSKVLARPCRECGGGLHDSVKIRGLDDSTIERKVYGRVCRSCGGEGFVVENATVAETKQFKGQALRTYTTLQRGRQYESVGNAWLPPGVADRITTRQTAIVLSVTASPCEECMGTGREDCRDCKGVGRIPCPERNCRRGQVEEKREGRLIKGTTTRLVKCRRCNGQSFIVCEDCLGKGHMLCDECQGKGTRELCRKCNGTGCIDCRKCDGLGKDRGVTCADCAGEGQVLCGGCSGDGRDR